VWFPCALGPVLGTVKVKTLGVFAVSPLNIVGYAEDPDSVYPGRFA
jgi:hypothetical protein